MSWRDIMQRVLPPIGGLSADVTSAGAYGAVKGRKAPHRFPTVASIPIMPLDKRE
jgi:hypothetical protein